MSLLPKPVPPEALRAKLHSVVEQAKVVADDPALKANAAKLAAEEDALREGWRAARRQQLGLLAEHIAHLDDPADSEALDAARSWRRMDWGDRPLFLILGGPFGRGKSFAAAWLVDQLGGWFLSSAHMASLKFNEDEIDAMIYAPCLVLDDFGMEADDTGGWQASHLFRVLSTRYAERRPTVITTNLWGKKFEARFSGELRRLWDRIMASARFVYCGGDSFRHRVAR